jgi:hypothetical protein
MPEQIAKPFACNDLANAAIASEATGESYFGLAYWR